MEGTGRLSGTLLVLGTDGAGDDADPVAALRPLGARLHSAFVEQPHDHLSWGGALTGMCAAARDEALAPQVPRLTGQPLRIWRLAF